MRYFEIISEGRDAPLYHGAELGAAIGIIQGNEIWGGTQQQKYFLTLNPKYKNIDETVFGVSLSRSINTSYNFGRAVFEINQRRLAQTHKLIPLDYWSALKKNGPSQRPVNNINNVNPEYEEFCVGAISPLDRYLVCIHVKKKTYEHLKSGILRTTNPDIILKHPLLKVSGIFVNQSTIEKSD